MPTGTCPECHRRIKLSPRGALYRHTYASRVCPGSGQYAHAEAE